jgi:hypothetical protein
LLGFTAAAAACPTLAVVFVMVRSAVVRWPPAAPITPWNGPRMFSSNTCSRQADRTHARRHAIAAAPLTSVATPACQTRSRRQQQRHTAAGSRLPHTRSSRRLWTGRADAPSCWRSPWDAAQGRRSAAREDSVCGGFEVLICSCWSPQPLAVSHPGLRKQKTPWEGRKATRACPPISPYSYICTVVEC